MEDLFDLGDFEEKPEENTQKVDEVITPEVKEVKNLYVRDEHEKIDIEAKLETHDIVINDKAMKLDTAETDEKLTKGIKFAIEDDLPLSEFDKIKEFALKFPFELDVFQKRSLVRLENKQVKSY